MVSEDNCDILLMTFVDLDRHYKYLREKFEHVFLFIFG